MFGFRPGINKSKNKEVRSDKDRLSGPEALAVTGEARYAELALLAARWFFGLNDTGVELADRQSGGCRDGLERFGANENQGAESTLALVSALQAVRRIQAAARSAASNSSIETHAAPTHRSAAPYVM